MSISFFFFYYHFCFAAAVILVISTTASASAVGGSSAFIVHAARKSAAATAAAISAATSVKRRTLNSINTYSPHQDQGRPGLYNMVDSFQDGTIQVSRPSSTKSHSIHYRIHNRMNLSSQKAAPILVLHGGPGVPSDYLYPLADVVPYRSIVFYDQLGCGRSCRDNGADDVGADAGNDSDSDSETKLGLDSYSIEASLDDLELLIKKVGLRRFHLYGQSFGGILAFEYIKRISEREQDPENNENKFECECLSVILSSSPTNVTQVEARANQLIDALLEEDNDMSTIAERFRIQNQCRTNEKPQPLVDAYEHAGTVWRGTDVIRDYVAQPPQSGAARMPSAMVMRGEHDFVGEECVEGWKEAFNHKFVRMKVLDGCSHHGLLENGAVYGEVVDAFFAEYD